jgi:DNA replicative helicase MCM subunit Mcm2 (Cdc46/Mcm family)
MKKRRLILTCGIFIFMFALLAVAQGCVPRQAVEQGEGMGEELVLSMPWSSDMDCGICHKTELASKDDTAYLYAMHTMQPNMDCVDCHDDAAALEQVHLDYSASLPERLSKTSADTAACYSCHDTEELATITVASTVLVDDKGTVVNPHDLPVNSDHAVIVCSDCHKTHALRADLDEAAMSVCIGCHHERVFECNTCH